MANIIIYDIAADSYGALVILNQIVREAEHDKANDYYIFLSSGINKTHGNLHYIYIKKKKGLVHRIMWDSYGLKRYLKKNLIIPNLIISMQNIALLGFHGIPQMVYLHQSVPFSDFSLNPMKKEERKLFFYKYVYKIMIFLTINFTGSRVYVQTEWMKERAVSLFRKSIKVKKIAPCIEKHEGIRNTETNNKYILFYPTSNFKYKNIDTIIKAIDYLKVYNPGIYERIELQLTIDKDLKYCAVSDKIKFIGYQSKDDMISLYENSSAMVFPSYLESFGLPLIEAASLGLPIIVSDLPYAREILGTYDGAKFINDYLSKRAWAQGITEVYTEVYKEGRNRYEPLIWNNEGWKVLFNDIHSILNNKKG